MPLAAPTQHDACAIRVDRVVQSVQFRVCFEPATLILTLPQSVLELRCDANARPSLSLPHVSIAGMYRLGSLGLGHDRAKPEYTASRSLDILTYDCNRRGPNNMEHTPGKRHEIYPRYTHPKARTISRPACACLRQTGPASCIAWARLFETE